MKRKRHKPEQIIKKLREADAMLAAAKTMGQVLQALEISEPTFHRWRNQYGGMKAEEAQRLKELEAENRRLKKLVAEQALDKDILKEALEGNLHANEWNRWPRHVGSRVVGSRSTTKNGRTAAWAIKRPRSSPLAWPPAFQLWKGLHSGRPASYPIWKQQV